MKKRIPYSYVIFYLERKYYHLIEKELKEKGYENIKVIIPTLDILKRTVKGKMVFESVPILFNYGFMRMPTENAFSRPFLNKLKRNISGIRTFLKSTETMHERKKKVPILCMRYNSMPANEFFFVVDYKLGSIIAQYITKSMYIQVPGNTLMVFMASEVLKVPYKMIHKQAKLIVKNQ